MDAILSSLLWFFYHHLNGSSEYIRPQRSIPRFLHFAQKTRNNLFHCSLFPRVVSPPTNESVSKFTSCLRILYPKKRDWRLVFQRWGCVAEEMKMCQMHTAWCIWGRSLSSGKLVKTASECKTQYFCSPKNFIKDNIWFCLDQRKNYFQTNPGSLQFICKCFFISNLFKLNDYFQLEIFFQNLKCFDFILEAKLGKYIHSNIYS